MSDRLEEIAKRHDVDPKVLAAVVEVQAAQRASQWQAVRRWSARVAAVMVVSLVVVTGRAIAAGNCTQTLPAPLITFCGDSPALAAEVNGNLQQLYSWILSPPASVAVKGNLSTAANGTAVGSITAAAGISGTTVNASGRVQGLDLAFIAPGATQGGQLMWNTVSPGLGRSELVNNRGTGSGGFAFYDRGAVANMPGAPLMQLAGNGLGGSVNLCVVPVACEDSATFACGGSTTCPNNKFAVGVTDGTGCGVTNKLRCCAMALTTCP